MYVTTDPGALFTFIEANPCTSMIGCQLRYGLVLPGLFPGAGSILTGELIDSYSDHFSATGRTKNFGPGTTLLSSPLVPTHVVLADSGVPEPATFLSIGAGPAGVCAKGASSHARRPHAVPLIHRGLISRSEPSS
jgi:hypothetical protein